MPAPFFNDPPQLPADAPADWPEERLADWCSLHRLIEELSSIQVRMGTPFEDPLDYARVRDLARLIERGLESVAPWLEQTLSR